MTERVLVPMDGSPLSERALEYALETFTGAEILVLNVIDPFDAVYESEAHGQMAGEEWYRRSKERAETLFESVRETAHAHGATVSTATEVGRPGRTIVEYAEAEDVDHVVVGSHGRTGVTRVLLGSVAEKVIRRSSVPVTVVR